MKKALKSKTVRIVVIEMAIRVAFIIIIAYLTEKYISEPAKQTIAFAIIVVLFIVIDAIVLIKFFKKESEEYLGWQLMWIYPFNQIMIAILIITIVYTARFERSARSF